MTLTEFLLARIAEDEEVANAAIDAERPGSHWHWVTVETDTVVATGDLELAQDGQGVSLRTVEAFDTTRGPLPAFPIASADEVDPGAGEHIARWNPARVIAECEAKRRIVKFHESWPVLAEQRPKFEPIGGGQDFAFRASQQIVWLTEQEYRKRFGDEPPTSPMIAALAAVYADHPDYRTEWRP